MERYPTFLNRMRACCTLSLPPFELRFPAARIWLHPLILFEMMRAALLDASPSKSTLDDDGQHVAILQLMVKPHSLVVELRTWSSNTGEAKFPNEITVQFDADVFDR